MLLQGQIASHASQLVFIWAAGDDVNGDLQAVVGSQHPRKCDLQVQMGLGASQNLPSGLRVCGL